MSTFVIHYADHWEVAGRCGRKAHVATTDLHAVSCYGCKRVMEPVNEDHKEGANHG